MNEAEIVTFGCRLNASESEAIRERLRAAGIGDAVVVNTCGVTAEAVRQSRQAIRKLRRERPGFRIVVTGCAAQVRPEIYAGMEEVDLVLGNGEKLDPENFRDQPDAPRVRVSDIMSVTDIAPLSIEAFAGKARAYLQIQTGCNHRCTFCIIPFGRGNSRSLDESVIFSEARKLTDAGFREIVLTGVDLTSFGEDLPGRPTLGALVRHLLAEVPDIRRLRLSSIDAIEADGDLMDAVSCEPRLMPYFHLSVQAGDDMILKRMKRRHNRQDIIDFCRNVRALRPDAAFGADLIAGFPTETDAMFENTLRLVGEAGLSQLHVFPFSPRAGTPAARMPQLPRETVKARARRLREAGAAAMSARLAAMTGSRQEILVEKPGVGRTPCFAQVSYSGAAAAGSFVDVRITGAGKDYLQAEFIAS